MAGLGKPWPSGRGSRAGWGVGGGGRAFRRAPRSGSGAARPRGPHLHVIQARVLQLQGHERHLRARARRTRRARGARRARWRRQRRAERAGRAARAGRRRRRRRVVHHMRSTSGARDAVWPARLRGRGVRRCVARLGPACSSRAWTGHMRPPARAAGGGGRTRSMCRGSASYEPRCAPGRSERLLGRSGAPAAPPGAGRRGRPASCRSAGLVSQLLRPLAPQSKVYELLGVVIIEIKLPFWALLIR